MRIYISGAITGTDDYMERFKAAEEILAGNEVLNPAAVCARLPELEYEEYMKVALTMLAMSEAIYMLPGWQQSRGANREYGYAIAKGMMIFYGEEIAPVQHSTGLTKERVQELLQEGHNLNDIKNMLGCNMTVLRNAINRWNLMPSNDDEHKKKQEERVRQYYSTAIQHE